MAVIESLRVPVAQRQGSFQSATYDVPVNAVGELVIRGEIAAADLLDPTKSFSLRLYVLNDAQTWKLVFGWGWQGHAENTERFPSQTIGVDKYRGRQIRLEADVPVRMRVGGTVELV